MRPLLDRLKSGEVLLADGAMGTMLMERALTGTRFGIVSPSCPEGFNLERPEILEEIARLYLDAGADIIQTNTFGASPLKLAPYGFEDRTEEINRTAVQAVRRVVGDRAFVFACCGPSGKLLKPFGDTEPAAIQASFERQVRILVEAGIDAVNFETMIDRQEAALAVRAAKAVSPSLPVCCTMTFERRRKGFFTVMGDSIPQVAMTLTQAGADVVGSNCGNGIEQMIEIAREFRAVAKLPVSIRANAGLPRADGDKLTYPETPEFMAGRLPELLDAGVRIVGGCCGTTPEHIRAFRLAIDDIRQRA